MKRKVIKIILIIVSVWCLFIGIDYMLSKNNKSPIFTLPLGKYRDGGTVEYYGLGYKIIKYNVIGGRKDTVFGFWNLKYNNEQQ